MRSKCCHAPMKTVTSDAADPSPTEEWEDGFNKKFYPNGYEGVIGLDPEDIKSFIHSLLSQQREELIEKLKTIRGWPEPQPGAGEGIGPLAGVGMYIQYNDDRKKHETQIDGLIDALAPKEKEKL